MIKRLISKEKLAELKKDKELLQSALEKLEKLGLTKEEIKALIKHKK